MLHWNRWDLTEPCLKSVDTQTLPKGLTVEKVVVDAGSEERLAPIPGWRVVRYEDSTGHIQGQNRCFESARGRWVLYLANDVRLLPTCLNTLWQENNYHISQPILYTPSRQIDNRGMHWMWPGYGTSSKYPEFEGVLFNGSCYLMMKMTWEAVGGFDEALRTSHEDIDFSLRAQRMGLKIGALSEAWALHLGNATLRHSPTHTKRAFHQDRLYVVRKHYRSLDRVLRVAAITVLDGVRGVW